MQSPIVIFNHITKSVTVAKPGPVHEQQVQEALAAQRSQITSAAGSRAR